ncbi:hypothetical protein WQE_04852 [Paraburkholderia hospita]|uniref:Uncharacterized protein n=1 Tax=Paraburkholderia hospita TaxID=169430 RepID=A0ABN0FTY8_9BURK|nr:hypothetical protein WQE_04852 [Paraburkholderia hospita]
MPCINKHFALFAWWNFCQSLDTFIAPAAGKYPGYILNDPLGCGSEAVHERIATELVDCLSGVEVTIGAPLTLARRHSEEDFWPANNVELEPIRRASAFALWCWDQAILAMYNADAASAAAAVAYGMDAANIAEEYRRDLQSDPDRLVQKARVMLGRAGAQGKLAKDPKQVEKKFVRDCWQGWQEDPSRYKSKAAFARDMMEKCAHLTSTKQIEDWCRDWEKQKKAM